MRTFTLALWFAVLFTLPAFAGENSEEDSRQSVLLIASYDGTIRAVQDVNPFKGDGIIDLRDEASLGVSAAFPPQMAKFFAFTDLAVGGDGVIVGADITNKYLVLQDLFERRQDKQTWLLALREEPWSVLVRGETIVYGMRYASPGQAPYVVGYLAKDRTQSNLLINRYVASGNKPFPTACTALEARSDGSVLCLDTDITGLPRNGRLWLIPGSILCSTCLGDPVMIYESPRLVSMAVDADSNYVYVALSETETAQAEIRRLDVDLRSRSVTNQYNVATGDLLHFDSQMANAFVFNGGQAHIGVNWIEPDGSQLSKAVVKVDPVTGDQYIYVSAEVVGTNNPIALVFWP